MLLFEKKKNNNYNTTSFKIMSQHLFTWLIPAHPLATLCRTPTAPARETGVLVLLSMGLSGARLGRHVHLGDPQAVLWGSLVVRGPCPRRIGEDGNTKTFCSSCMCREYERETD